jgi:hypothetical protein
MVSWFNPYSLKYEVSPYDVIDVDYYYIYTQDGRLIAISRINKIEPITDCNVSPDEFFNDILEDS